MANGGALSARMADSGWLMAEAAALRQKIEDGRWVVGFIRYSLLFISNQASFIRYTSAFGNDFMRRED